MVQVYFEQMTATDASFLRVETPHEPQHVGSLSVLDGGPLRDADGRIRFDDLLDHVGRRLQRVPRLRQRVMEVPYAQGRPVWIDDDRFDLAYHVRLTALPRPGDDEQLSALMSRLQALPLDRSRPLWEMWFVDGLVGDDVALIIKTHHALGDGIANVDLALALVDLVPEPDPDPPTPRWTPRPAPTPRQLLNRAIARQLTRPARLAGRALSVARDPRPLARAATDVTRTLVDFVRQPEPAPWNVPVSPHRRWVHADVSFDLVDQIRAHRAATVNDVVLAACTGALRRFLADRGEGVDDRVLKAMVPVSLRTDDEHGDTLGNRISIFVVDLPVHEADPVSRLERLHATTTELKESGYVAGTKTIVELADGVIPLAGPLTRLVSRRIPMNLVITNIPGPPIPLFLLGARIHRTYPYVEVIDDEGLTIAVVSYERQLFFGITSDRDVVPDLAEVAAEIENELQSLATVLADSASPGIGRHAGRAPSSPAEH
jgi:diacylglycerol O-acyltransferase